MHHLGAARAVGASRTGGGEDATGYGDPHDGGRVGAAGDRREARRKRETETERQVITYEQAVDLSECEKCGLVADEVFVVDQHITVFGEPGYLMWRCKRCGHLVMSETKDGKPKRRGQ